VIFLAVACDFAYPRRQLIRLAEGPVAEQLHAIAPTRVDQVTGQSYSRT